jgi:sulfite exporter TauE/SafE
MCGPLVLAQVSRNWARLKIGDICPRQRIRQGLLLPYHVGRLISYSGLGALAASSGALVGGVSGLGAVPAILLALGAVLLFGQALARLMPGRISGLLHLPLGWGARVSSLAGRIDRDSPLGALLFGIVLGFLPCGLLYAALAVAASLPGPLEGGMAMFAFGLGTVPSLMALGVLGQMAGQRWTQAVAKAAPVLLLLNAAVLATMAWQRFVTLA